MGGAWPTSEAGLEVVAMGDQRAEKAEAAGGFPADLKDLLSDDITYAGWEQATGIKKAFYVRGFTWFRDAVLAGRANITEAANWVPGMRKRLLSRQSWVREKFDWQEGFSARQFIDAASVSRRAPLRFAKAVQVLVLCEAIAEDLRGRYGDIPQVAEIYARMRIQPAVSYIHAFDRTAIEAMQAEDSSAMVKLRRYTGQPTPQVFQDMADGKTVSETLAKRTAKFIGEKHPSISLGEVSHRLDRRRSFVPSDYEFLDLKENDLPNLDEL